MCFQIFRKRRKVTCTAYCGLQLPGTAIISPLFADAEVFKDVSKDFISRYLACDQS